MHDYIGCFIAIGVLVLVIIAAKLFEYKVLKKGKDAQSE